jgi:transposase
MTGPQESEGNPMARYVGIDAHSKHCVYAIEDESGSVIREGQVPTTPEGLLLLKTRHALPTGTPVALESGTMAFFVARHLMALELTPVVVDAREVRLKASRPTQKSDRRDALELCEGLRRGIYRTLIHVPPVHITQLRETLGRRRHFVRLKTMQTNAAKRLLRGAGLGALARSLGSERAWERLVAALAFDPMLQTFVASHHALWRCAQEQVSLLEHSLHAQQQLLQHEMERLQRVPGVGPIVALTVLATFSDVTRFPSAKHAASYAGLVSSTHQSGDRDRHGRITKRGSTELRAMLCEAAHHASRPEHPLYPYFSSLCLRRGYRMAIVAVAHRLCRILFTMLRRQTDFDPSRLNIEEGPFERTSVRRYRLKPALA